VLDSSHFRMAASTAPVTMSSKLTGCWVSQKPHAASTDSPISGGRGEGGVIVQPEVPRIADAFEIPASLGWS
jgi:hypothetical protein